MANQAVNQANLPFPDMRTIPLLKRLLKYISRHFIKATSKDKVNLIKYANKQEVALVIVDRYLARKNLCLSKIDKAIKEIDRAVKIETYKSEEDKNVNFINQYMSSRNHTN